MDTERAVKIVLFISRGCGFNFLKQRFAISCSIKDFVVETRPTRPRHTPIIETRLAWETNLEEYHRMCRQNVPIKIEIITLHPKNERRIIGYLLLSLLSAKFCPPNDENKIVPMWHKLLDVSSKGKSSNPQILLKLMLEDSDKLPSPISKEFNKLEDYFTISMVNEKHKNENMSTTTKDMNIKYLEDGSIQVGKSLKIYLLDITIKTFENLQLLLNGELDDEENVQYIKFTIFSKNIELSISKDDKKISLQIKSDLKTLLQYFSENPYIVVRYGNEIQDFGMCFFEIGKVIHEINSNVPNLDQNVEPLLFHENCYLVNCKSNEMPTGPNGEKPSIEIECSLKCDNQINAIFESFNINNEKISAISPISLVNSSSPLHLNDDNKTLKIVIPDFPDFAENRSPAINSEISSNRNKEHSETDFTPRMASNKQLEQRIEGKLDLISPRTREQHIVQIVRELEDWMDHQKEIFKSYLIDKEKKYLDLLKNEWEIKKKDYEDVLTGNIEQCRNFMSNLNDIVDNLKVKELQIDEREQKLRHIKDELELDYKNKYYQLNHASKQMENHFEHQLKLHEIEYSKLYTELKMLKQENSLLKDRLQLFERSKLNEEI